MAMQNAESVLNGLKLRPHQKVALDFIVDGLRRADSVILESPTGSGKTLIALTSAYRYASEEGRKILYLTRTNSQQQAVFRDLGLFLRGSGIRAAPLQGRQNMCLLYREISQETEFSSESLSRFCNSRKKMVREGNPSACRFFNSRISSRETSDRILGGFMTAEELLLFGRENTICPYESVKASLKSADLVVAPYAFFLNYNIAERFLDQWGVDRSDLVVILDEAHNLPDLARNIASFQISVRSLDAAESEIGRYGDPELIHGIHASDAVEYMRDSIQVLARDFLGDNDESRIKHTAFMENLMIVSKQSSAKIHEMLVNLDIHGENVASTMEKEGRIPRSHILAITQKILAMDELDEDLYISTISSDNGGTLSVSCLDPSRVLDPLRLSKTVHISGTLSPVDSYMKITGFTESRYRIIGPVFPERNHLMLYSTEITTKYDRFDSSEIERMRSMIEHIIATVKRKCIVFFPSHAVMEKVISGGFVFPFLAELKSMNQEEISEVISDFRNGEMPLMAVSGGRISEGLDFPGRQLQMVIVAGIPYPRPDARQKAMFQFYEKMYGSGWEMSVTFPAIVRIRQEIGRLIRSESDYGVSIILDSRISAHRKYFPGLRSSSDPAKDALHFFMERDYSMDSPGNA